jgi:osmotically-inducible protein OsmY
MKDDTMPTPAAGTEERWLHGAVDESGHRGKGPKNYHRSDPRIFEDVSEALTDNDAVDASDVDVTVKDGEVLLDGAVETQRMKEIAEELVSAVSGVKSVRNMLRTQPRAD